MEEAKNDGHIKLMKGLLLVKVNSNIIYGVLIKDELSGNWDWVDLRKKVLKSME
jgi:hypothetical protein